MKNLYCVGDIHGHLSSLHAVLTQIKIHVEKRANEDNTLVFVGDYIDRGPDSRQVLELVKKLTEEGFEGMKVVALKGNHEDMMLRADDSYYYKEMWLHNGGFQCLESFHWDRTTTKVRDIFGHELFDWIKKLPLFYENGTVAVAHAGIDEKDMRAQDHSSKELLWSRKLCKHSHKYYNYTVHGHTPMDNAYVGPNTAYIDTGAVWSGRLTCLFIPNTESPNHKEMELIQTR